ncbi:N-terminal double-transmembrane domain-containing protein [Marivirga sericea]|uniref:N-terminal double-transmembrane domain-containing protein n=1 Tax=Marivirga sericea TaxID=1028 RepID=A0A1X7IJ67_9BACT|nr:BatA domain-containing protein [Marivirga sericea]SMG14496.1 N-terminal double-transmembrane domain-containing protein [Marivirga sericea]
MNWLNPIALWGLTALALPIIIHLWSKNKTKEIAFGSIRFLKESSTLQSKRIQFSELPLLLLRMLILFLLVMLLAKWVRFTEVEKEKALLLGEGIQVPEAYQDDEFRVLNTAKSENSLNQWYLLEKLSKEYPEIDSLIYINNFGTSDFTGEIPKLNFQLELISTGESMDRNQEPMSQDTILIHFAELSQVIEQKLRKVLKANHLYTKEKVNFIQSEKQKAHLIIGNSTHKQEANQIVLTDTISDDYEVERKYTYSILYLNEKWLNNPLNEDMFLSVVTEFIGQIVEPNYQYSSFDALYTRTNEDAGSIQKAQRFEQVLLGMIVFLIVLERFLSYKKRNA